jgi:hypothetical protein
MKHELNKVLKILPTDYTEYGGEVNRWEDPNRTYPDCSNGCKFFVPLNGDLGNDWGVCSNPESPRAGLLTWEHQTGVDCFTPDDPNRYGFHMKSEPLLDQEVTKMHLTHLEWITMIADYKYTVERDGNKLYLYDSNGEFVDDVFVDEKYSKSQQKRLEALQKLSELDENHA